MNKSIYNLEFRIETGKVSNEDALKELEAHVRQIDSLIGTHTVNCLEVIEHNYDNSVKMSMAANLIREVLNNLYKQVEGK